MSAPDPGSVFDETRRRIEADPGVRLFTVLQWLPERRTLRRVASTHPTEYPVGAEKSLEVSGGWLDAVIDNRRSFLGTHESDVAAVFADIDLIRSLGCGSVINTPILSRGVSVGVLAILDRDGAYDDQSVTTVERHVNAMSEDLASAFAQLSCDSTTFRTHQ